MKIIYKYQLNLAVDNQTQMPQGAEILSIQYQGPHLCLWALVDPNAPTVSRKINMYGTGIGFSEPPGKHITTIQESGYIWHFFDGGEQ